MATTLTNLPTGGASIWSRIGSFFSGMYLGLAAFGDSSSRMKEITKLNSLSDDQLKELGIRREDIARYVFRDMLYV